MNKEKKFIIELLNKTNKYTVSTVPKKDGSKRTIYAPRAELRRRQVALKKQLDLVKISRGAAAYKKGVSIKTTMNKHKNDKVFFKFDFVDFFASFTIRDIKRLLPNTFNWGELGTLTYGSHLVWSKKEEKAVRKKVLSRFVPQGSLTAPVLTNILMYYFDEAMLKYVEKTGGHYSRYADDILVSFPERVGAPTLAQVRTVIQKQLKYKGLKFLKLNSKKTRKMVKKVRFLGTYKSSENKITIGAKNRKSLLNTYRALLRGSGTKVTRDLSKLLGKIAYHNHINSDKQIDVSELLKNRFGSVKEGWRKVNTWRVNN